jgi:hypothetical protein
LDRDLCTGWVIKYTQILIKERHGGGGIQNPRSRSSAHNAYSGAHGSHIKGGVPTGTVDFNSPKSFVTSKVQANNLHISLVVLEMALESVLITGCSAGGIGSAIAIEFQNQGLNVFATARDVRKLAHLIDLANVTILSLDVTSKQSVDAAVEAVKKSKMGGGKLKYLVNNAGLGHTTPLIHADTEPGSNAREMWEVNYWGVLRVTKAFSELLIQEKGCVVNIGSGAGLVYWPWTGLSPDSPKYPWPS